MDTLTSTSLDIEILVLLDMENNWEYSCEHPKHRLGTRGHSDESDVLPVIALQLPCCGISGRSQHLCESWIVANPSLRCPICHISYPFEDCYRVLPKGD